ncbi:MAG: oligogalacturonate lyase family protein [Anaerolineae bacterium]|nr:oligogalacturonate lyase family protein [Anaerolineae bacterium]
MTRTGIGARWTSEMITYQDSKSGATIHQMTSHKGHSNHFYFTYPCWYDDGRKIVFTSDRENRTNLFGVDLASGEITQLTDFAAEERLGSLSKNPVREEIYFNLGATLMALDLTTLETRALATCPEGYVGGGANATADGKYLVTGYRVDLSDQILTDLGHGYIGFRETWEAHPHTKIMKIPVDGGDPEVIFEEDYWLGHFNASPKLPNIMTFCHEGPWNLVENRIWGLDINTGETWQIRPNAPGESIGHEYWMQDGEHVGYHGQTAGGPVYGAIRYDDTDQVEAPFEGHCWHFHSYMLDLVVGDGDAKDPYVLLWRFKDGEFQGPKVLAWHRGSFHIQRVHVHPCFNQEGTQIVYTADPQGYGQVFVVDVPAFETLPDLVDVKG